MKKPQHPPPIPFPEGDPSTWPSIIYDEEPPETPEDHLADAELIAGTLVLAGIAGLGDSLRLVPDGSKTEIRMELIRGPEEGPSSEKCKREDPCQRTLPL